MSRGIVEGPTRRHDDDLCATADQLAKGFGEGKVPAYQQTDFAEGTVDDGMIVCRWNGWGGDVGTFGVPEVAFGVGAEDVALRGDEVGGVDELWSGRRRRRARGAPLQTIGRWVLFDDCAGDDVDAEFSGEGAVTVQVAFVLGGLDGELERVGDPTIQMVPEVNQ